MGLRRKLKSEFCTHCTGVHTGVLIWGGGGGGGEGGIFYFDTVHGTCNSNYILYRTDTLIAEEDLLEQG